MSNKQIVNNFSPDTPFITIMKEAGRQLAALLQNFLDIILNSGLINVDFSDIESVLRPGGRLFIGRQYQGETGISGDVIGSVLDNVVLEPFDISRSSSAILSVEAGPSFNLGLLHEIGDSISSLSSADIHMIMGITINPDLGERVNITVLMIGRFDSLNPECNVSPISQNRNRHE